MTVCQAISMSLSRRYREQARSHRGFLVNAEPVNTSHSGFVLSANGQPRLRPASQSGIRRSR